MRFNGMIAWDHGVHRSSICEYQLSSAEWGGEYRAFHFLRSLITLYNVPTPIPTTQVTLNQHAGVLLSQRFCPLESVEEKMGVWKRLDGLGLLDRTDDAWLMMWMRFEIAGNGGMKRDNVF